MRGLCAWLKCKRGVNGCSGADPRARMGDALWRLLPAQNKLLKWEAGVIFVIWMTNAPCSAVIIQISIVLRTFETPTITACEYLPSTGLWWTQYNDIDHLKWPFKIKVKIHFFKRSSFSIINICFTQTN